MKKLTRILLFLLLMSVAPEAIAQQESADSLQNIVSKNTGDTTQVNALLGLFLQYEFEDRKKAADCLKKAFALSETLGFKKGQVTTYLYMGYFQEDESKNTEALNYYNLGLNLAKKIDYKKGIAACHNNIGNIHLRTGQYPLAAQNYLASLKVYLASGNSKGAADAYGNMGIVYFYMNDSKAGLANNLAAMEIYRKIGDKYGLADSYQHIGNMFAKKNNYPAALENFSIALKISEEIDYKTTQAYCYSNIGLIHQLTGNYRMAIENYELSLKMNEALGNKLGIAVSFGNMGEAYTGLKDFNRSRDFLNKAIDISNSTDNKEVLKNAYLALTKLDSATGNYKGAYENHKRYIAYRDSLDNEGSRNEIVQTQMTYEFEKKEAVAQAEHKKELENQDKIAQEKSHKQKVILAFVAGGLLLVIIFAAFVFRSLRITKKQKSIIEAQKQLVEDQKREVEMQKHLLEEKQREIIDSIKYARRIQHSLLPSEGYIQKNINRLKNK